MILKLIFWACVVSVDEMLRREIRLKGSHTCDPRSIEPDRSPETQCFSAVWSSDAKPLLSRPREPRRCCPPPRVSLLSLTRDKTLFFSLAFFWIWEGEKSLGSRGDRVSPSRAGHHPPPHLLTLPLRGPVTRARPGHTGRSPRRGGEIPAGGSGPGGRRPCPPAPPPSAPRRPALPSQRFGAGRFVSP